MMKTTVKFHQDWLKTVGGVALTRYLLETRNHASRKAEYYVPSLFFEKAGANNSKMGDNSDKKKKKIQVTYFFMKNPYMKFQNISIPGSKVMLCTRKRDKRTNE